MARALPRNTWTNRDPKSIIPLEGKVSEVFFHWPAQESFNLSRPLEDYLQIYQRYHMDDLGWDDIAYHHAVFPDGRRFELRGWGVRGAATFGHNRDSYALLFMVDEGDEVTLPQVDAAIDWLQEGETLGRISRDAEVRGHGEVRDTSCPGPAVTEIVELIRQDGWWNRGGDGGPRGISPELRQVYLDLLGREPGDFALVWQKKLDMGQVSLDEVRWKLLAVRLELLPLGSEWVEEPGPADDVPFALELFDPGEDEVPENPALEAPAIWYPPETEESELPEPSRSEGEEDLANSEPATDEGEGDVEQGASPVEEVAAEEA